MARIECCPDCGRECRRRNGVYYCPICDETFNGRTIGQRIDDGFTMLSDDYDGGNNEADDCA